MVAIDNVLTTMKSGNENFVKDTQIHVDTLFFNR